MINGEANNYYFAVKDLLDLNSFGWLSGKKEAVINGDNEFQNALDDALNYQNTERDPQRISKIKPYINKYNWEGIEFPGGSKDYGENMGKCITFSVPIKKKCGGAKAITYKLRFIDSFRFMTASLLELVDNMSGNFDSIECKNNNCKECKKLIEELIKKFPSIYQFWNDDLNEFILLLRKSVYLFKYIDNWEKFDETILPSKEAF